MTVCPFTTAATEAPLFRLWVPRSPDNGLEQDSSVMLDKITTVPRSALGERLGSLSDEEMLTVGRAMVVFLGVAA